MIFLNPPVMVLVVDGLQFQVPLPNHQLVENGSIYQKHKFPIKGRGDPLE